MKERDRAGFVARVRQARADGKSLTEAVELAYGWLLKPSRQAHAAWLAAHLLICLALVLAAAAVARVSP